MLISVDGKISTGDNDLMDVDKDYPKITGLKEGLSQYYEIEKTTDHFSLNTGRVFEKIGINGRKEEPRQIPVQFVVVDNKPHLTETGVDYISRQAKKVIIVTTNKDHPAYNLKKENVSIIYYDNSIDFVDCFNRLKKDFGAEKLTIQSGGTLNSTFIRNGLVDRVLLVVAPALVGGKNTSSLMDGESLHSPDELFKIKTLELVQAKTLKDSYLLLEYTVRN